MQCWISDSELRYQASLRYLVFVLRFCGVSVKAVKKEKKNHSSFLYITKARTAQPQQQTPLVFLPFLTFPSSLLCCRLWTSLSKFEAFSFSFLIICHPDKFLSLAKFPLFFWQFSSFTLESQLGLLKPLLKVGILFCISRIKS